VVTTLTGRGGNYAVAIDDGAVTVQAEPGVRLLKIWQNLQPDQKLCLQRVSDGGAVGGGGDGCDTYDDDAASEMSGYRAHRKRRRDVVKYASRTVHPKRLSNTQAAEGLLKLILEQSDTIRAQLKKLQDRDKKIEKIETETHRTRADALGSNYLLDAYLGGGGDDKEEKDSGITEGASVENDDGGGCSVGGVKGEIENTADTASCTLEAIAYLEQIVRINKKLYEYEERMIRLYVNVERCRDQDQLLDELKRVEDELADTERAYRENGMLIRDVDVELRTRLGYVEQLQYEAAIVDSENEYLASFIEHHRHQQQQQNRLEHHKHLQQQHRHNVSYRVLDTLV
jgi:tetratricopeptide (TPR) repeat protein